MVFFMKGVKSLKSNGYCDEFSFRSANPSVILKEASALGVWDVKRRGTLLTLKVSCENSVKLRKIADKHGIYVQSVSHKGAKNLISFLKARPMVPVGIVVFILLFLFASSFCYSVTFFGLHEVSEMQIMEKLSQMEILFPVAKSQIDKETIESELFMSFEEFIYVQAEFNGTVLELTFQEGAKIPEKEQSAPADIVATKSGVIVDMTVLRGMPSVSVGQKVEEGQVLVAGNYLVSQKPILMTADASVTAQIIYEGISEKPISDTQYLMTGNYVTGREISLGGAVISEFNSPYENSEQEIVEEILLGENSPVCVLIKDVVYYEVVEYKTDRSAFVAEVNAREEAYYNALADIEEGAEIISVGFDVSHSKTGVFATAYIITEEEIARIKTIDEQVETQIE